MTALHTIRRTAVLAAIVALAMSAALQAAPKERVLVLGFASRQLNDLQDRLLRETVLYRLHAIGHEIVPVMEIESLFRDDSKRFIRRLSRADVRTLCDELNAGVAVFGSIAPDGGRQDEAEIRKGKNYICLLTVYRKSDDRFTETKLMVTGRDSLYVFFIECAADIADGIQRVSGAPVNPPRS
jgi:hypothetical protein